MKRVVVLAYFFPPLGGAGVQRALKFVKYLPEYGWQATVVTTTSMAYPVGDASLLEEIPSGTRVLRAAEPDGWRWLVSKVAGLCEVLRIPGLARFVTWPDEALLWGPSAFVRVLREVRRERPDALFTTSAPFTSHIVGLVVSRLTGLPWIADFRDEWANNPYVKTPRPLIALNRLLERAIARHAAQRIVVADYFRLDGEGPRPVEIPNGVDDADLAGLPAPEPASRDRLRLTFVGTLYGSRDCAPVFQGLRRLLDCGLVGPSEVEVRVIGNAWLRDLEAKVPVPLVTTGYVGHRDALMEMRTADALLFYVPPGDPSPSGKIFEYLASERPVLCVAEPGNLASRLVAEFGAGVVAAPGDPAAVEAALLSIVERWRAGALSPTGAQTRTLERFGRRALAGRLAEELSRAAA